MRVEAPEYDSSGGPSSANITDTEDEPPKRKRRQTTKKVVELVTELKVFAKKASSTFSKISDGTAAPTQSAIWKGVNLRAWSKRDLLRRF